MYELTREESAAAREYRAYIDRQYARAIVKAIRANADTTKGKHLSIEGAIEAIAHANARARNKHAWLNKHPNLAPRQSEWDEEDFD